MVSSLGSKSGSPYRDPAPRPALPDLGGALHHWEQAHRDASMLNACASGAAGQGFVWSCVGLCRLTASPATALIFGLMFFALALSLAARSRWRARPIELAQRDELLRVGAALDDIRLAARRDELLAVYPPRHDYSELQHELDRAKAVADRWKPTASDIDRRARLWSPAELAAHDELERVVEDVNRRSRGGG